ncbi:uncharacterized protein LOC106772307 isoform X2 [Vigna radiata var. radiata]|uniref:Uncharacterized protein LOC106772307 isoform X2 n=1 Tax=Vigna radiata var. radiata TaxID=3916 RepID=A0A3Q0F899_VIGRR|nr:uncharacterized protein LOC106772307 isoform X2 [Vigna radiata var. radiata]
MLIKVRNFYSAGSTLAVVLYSDTSYPTQSPRVDLRIWMHLLVSSIILSYFVPQIGSSDINTTTEATSFLLCSTSQGGSSVNFQKKYFPLYTSLPRVKQVSKRLIYVVAKEDLPKQVEESNMETPKEIFLKEYKMSDYYFDNVKWRWIRLVGHKRVILKETKAK